VDTAAQHAQLLEKINQLNVLRESNTTLRAESEAQSRRAQKLEVQLQKLAAELDPIKEQARLSQAEVEARGEQIKMLEEDNLRWKNRTQQIIQKVCYTSRHFMSEN
jgi:nucleoprotein TPR